MDSDDLEDSFEMFIRRSEIRWIYYKDVHKILGQTYGLLVIQDFEAVSPNLLCRTIETVEGGGSVVFLIDKLENLKMLYTLKLEVHSRYRPNSNGLSYEPRFTERFLLSLNNCKDIMVVDDELNVLPIFK